MPNTREKGSRWERVAESFLHDRGLRTVERNYQCRCGEIDLVMLDRTALVFVEVRYRQSDRFGSGADSVTRPKQRRIISAARQFLGCNADYRLQPCRFDVISIGLRSGTVQMNWIRGAFEVE